MTAARLRVALAGYTVAETRRAVLGPIAFSLAPGETVALFGPSGCGKTTLLKLIGGLIASPAGAVAWNGAAPRLGWVFQEPLLLPWRTLHDNIRLALPAGGDPGEIAPLLAALGLDGWADAFPNRLSLGMARRAAVARALACRPDMLLLDEPFASLDAATAEVVRELLRQRRLTTLLVTHDPGDVAALADRALVLGGSPTRIRGVVTIDAATRSTAADRIAALQAARPGSDDGGAQAVAP
jgi:ABC-type nitrate/sulfonate/bicarbonate transport system ATPase subunit